MLKKKIINDPIYGFITIPDGIIFNLIEHPWFQRLRRISQLGVTNLVYPGANHTRFHHALGAMHLMHTAIEVLRSKGVSITEKEAEGAKIAILLHDIGHGPFSHNLENTLVKNINHEQLSLLMMEHLNKEFNGQLSTAIKIFTGKYKKIFLHQLVSSQLDVDRLDYLTRDTFFTGVSEGVIGYDRIIKMLNVRNDKLMVESKGIYSVEKFIIARRLMYWQVYLHKTALSGMELQINILRRARELLHQKYEGQVLFCTPALKTMLTHSYSKRDFLSNPGILDTFAAIDDYDVMLCIKEWTQCSDLILSTLTQWLVNRHLYKIKISRTPFKSEEIKEMRNRATEKYKVSIAESYYFVFSGEVFNDIYNTNHVRINILYPDETILDITKASDHLNASALDRVIKKYFLCFPNKLT